MKRPRRLVLPMLTILPSCVAIAGEPGLGVDVDPAAAGVGLDRHGRVVALGDLLVDLALGQVVGVGRLGADREVALGQAGERADEVGGQAADQAGAHEDRVDVPVGVVVGEDRLAHVGVGAGGLQVPRGREDRVDRVVGVLLAVVVGVDAVLLPRGRHELHPAQRAGGGDVEVAAVVGLDLVDAGQDLPAHAVLDAGGLVDRKQEGRDPELVDEEVRDADRPRRPGAPARSSGWPAVGMPSPWRMVVASGLPSALSFLDSASSPVALRSVLPTVFCACWPPAEAEGALSASPGPLSAGVAVLGRARRWTARASAAVPGSAGAVEVGSSARASGAGVGAELVPVSAGRGRPACPR